MKLSTPQLCIDTSLSTGCVVYRDSGGVITGAWLPPRQQELLLADTVKKLGVPLTALHIYLGAGPGTFTGLRIAYSFVKGLVSDLDDAVRITTVSSLLGYGLAVAPHRNHVGNSFGFEARRDEYFIQRIRQEGLSPIELLTTKELTSEPSLAMLQESTIQQCTFEQILSGFLIAASSFHTPQTPSSFMLSEPCYGREAAAKTAVQRQSPTVKK